MTSRTNELDLAMEEKRENHVTLFVCLLQIKVNNLWEMLCALEKAPLKEDILNSEEEVKSAYAKSAGF